MRVLKNIKAWTVRSEEGDCLTLRYDNRGDPYRTGATLMLQGVDYSTQNYVFLETDELRELRDKLNELIENRE